MKIIQMIKNWFTIRYVCPVPYCNKRFETKKGLNIHLAIKQDKEHICYRNRKK